VFVPGLARADASEANEARALEKQLDQEHAALSTTDCDAACRALVSIRRAAEKICALEPGPRCDSASAKAADATRRVHDACPDCVIAAAPSQPAPNPSGGERVATADVQRTAASSPQEAGTRGGCRSCAAIDRSSSHSDVALIVLGVLAGVRLIGRRSKKERRGP
jgi:hypothetical protein